MNNFDTDPTEPLLDISFQNVADGFTRTSRVEQPKLGCTCDEGWIDKSWLYRRASECNCEAATSDFLHALHTVECDAVPCPFCRQGQPS